MSTDLSLQIAYGRLLLRSGQTDEAITVLEGVASQAPYVAEPFVLLAEARTSQGRMFEAAEALAQAADINPRYYVSLGELYERLGRWAAAAGAYGQAVAGRAIAQPRSQAPLCRRAAERPRRRRRVAREGVASSSC